LGVLTDTIEVVIESNRLFVFATGLMRVLFLLFAITHWSACAWYLVGYQSNEDGETSWVHTFIRDVDETDLSTKYAYSVYFALTTMTTVGYGDITAQNATEVRFVLVLLLIASLVFAMIMGALTDLICNLNTENNALSGQKVMLSRYMRWRAVPKELFMSVRDHLLFLWETNEGYGEFEGLIKEQLPPHLKRELCYHIYGGIIRAAPFFSWLTDCEICMKELAQTVESIFLSKGDHLFHVGQPNEHVYVLLKGTLYISQNEKLSLAPSNPEGLESTFAIPRSKEAGAMDVIRMMLSRARSDKHEAAQQEDEHKQHVLDIMQGPPESDSDEEVNTGDHVKKQESTLETHVDSHVLHAAANRLKKQDFREQRSARYIQRRWKRKIKARARAAVAVVAGKRLSSAKSKMVHAPAYFGESCLWVPLDEWETTPPPKYPYTAECETRGEFVYFSRRSVKDVIEQFSPWLGSRFDFFRESVVENIKKAELGKEEISIKGKAKEASKAADKSEGDGAGIATHESLNEQKEPAAAAPAVSSNGEVDTAAPAPAPAPKQQKSELVPAFQYAGSPEVGLPPGRINYEAFAAMNYSLGGIHPGEPVDFSTSVRHGPQLSMRTFRSAAAAAVARVSMRVTPPAAQTPRTGFTPRGSPTSGKAAAAKLWNSSDSETLVEPLLQEKRDA
jgi:hypothetical protein